MATHPEWATRHKRKGTELRLLNGHYYLYEVSSKWNPEKKRPQKITGKLLGKITEKDGFVMSDKDRLRTKEPMISHLSVKEYGVTLFITEILEQYPKLLQKHFPLHWQTIMALAYGRILHRAPLKNMAFHFQHSFLSELYTDTTLSAKELGWVLRELGNSRSDIVAFFREFSKANDCILFDGTDINSCSEKIGINKNGKSKKGTYDKLINLMFVFSVGQQLPIYYRITPGNIKDVKSFKLCLKESGVKDAVIIADKGFYSENNVKQLNVEGLKFIVPLKRDSLRIDYSKVKQADKQIFDNYFKFEDRFIWHYTHQSGQFNTVVYLDLDLKTREERDFLDRIETCPKKYTIEKFHQKQHTFGTISLLNNLEKTPKEIYEDYKSRDEIELMIDTLKNVVEADKSYMQNEQALEGWMFINYIGLHWYYKLFHMLIKNKLNKMYSPADFLKILTEVRKVKINESWHNAEITRKTADLIGKVGVHIT